MSFLTGILQEAASIVEAEDELELLEEMVLLNEDESIGQTVLGVKIPLPQLESDERIVMMAEALFEEACKSRLIGEGDDFDEGYSCRYDELCASVLACLYNREEHGDCCDYIHRDRYVQTCDFTNSVFAFQFHLRANFHSRNFF